MADDRDGLAVRIARLERSNARLRAGLAVVALAGSGVLLAAGDPPPKEPQQFGRVEVRRLVLVDDKGATRAELGMDPDGATGLWVRPETGKREAAFVGLSKGGDSSLVLRNDAGMGQIILTVDDGEGAIVLCNAEGKSRGQFTVGKDGSTLVGLTDGEPGFRASFSVMPDGTPYMKLDDDEGALKVVAGPAIEWRPRGGAK